LGCDEAKEGPLDESNPSDGAVYDGAQNVEVGDLSIINDMRSSDATLTLDASDAGDAAPMGDATTLDDGVAPMMDVGLMVPADAAMPDAELVNCVSSTSQLEFVIWPLTFANNYTGCHLPGRQADLAGVGFVLYNPDNPDRESRADSFAYNL
jgi:hypothetical protein